MEDKTLHIVKKNCRNAYEAPAIFTMKLSENIMMNPGVGPDAGCINSHS